MSAISDYLENKLLDHVLKGTSWAQPTNIYLALHSADPTDVGTTGEISGGSYARQLISSSFAAAASGSKASNADISFTNMPACTVSHVSIWDTVSGGTSANVLWQGSLSANKTVNGGDTFKILSGNLTCTLA